MISAFTRVMLLRLKCLNASQVPHIFLLPAMSTVDLPGSCANTDISGIGVRVATYAQNILGFVPAFYAILDDGAVSKAELTFIKDQSTNLLLTAFGLLISVIVQAVNSQGLDNYHAALVLNLSWMNNTSTFIWFILYAHYRSKAEDFIPPSFTCMVR